MDVSEHINKKNKIHDDVISGESDWLFLHEGTNNSYSYLSGYEPIKKNTLRLWHQLIDNREHNIPSVINLICPEKLVVYEEKLDNFELDCNRAALKLTDKASVIYPVVTLKGGKSDQDTYPKTDTHFNDFGAYLVIKRVLEHWGIQWPFQPVWKSQMVRGDLGIKLNPVAESDKLTLINWWPVGTVSNGLSNRGRIIYYKNDHGNDRRLLIFGDSFSAVNLAKMFTGVFSEVLFVNSLSLDQFVVDAFKPNYVLFEWAERFLREVPNDEMGVDAHICDKIYTGQKEAVITWRDDLQNQTRRFVNWRPIEAALRASRDAVGD